MKRTFFALLALNLALVPSVFVAPTSPFTGIEVKGEVTKPQTWTLEQLKKLAPVQIIKTTLKGKPYTVRGIRLWSLIEAANPKLDTKSKHSEARFVVLARGTDGYLASFALPELLPEADNKAAFVVWEADGKPLSAKEGPLRLVVPNEKKPMRWVYNLAKIEIYDGKKLSSR